jgi:L-asparaginase/Glu-tRNA(Gln) amidotransferase subunit D
VKYLQARSASQKTKRGILIKKNKQNKTQTFKSTKLSSLAEIQKIKSPKEYLKHNTKKQNQLSYPIKASVKIQIFQTI